MVGDEKLQKLHLNSLSADVLKVIVAGDDGLPGGGLNAEMKLTGEADGAEHPERILLEAVPGIPHAADDTVLQIVHAAEQIDEAVRIIVRHGIDGEIPAHQILPEAGGESHIVRPAVVFIQTVDAVSGHLISGLIHHDGDSTVFDAGIDGFGKKRFYLFRSGGGGDIPVGRRLSENGISDAASHRIGFVAVGGQGLYNLCCLCWN